MLSINFHDGVLLVYKVFICGPDKNAAKALPKYSRQESDEEARQTFFAIYFQYSMGYSLIVLVCVLVMKLEESARPDQVQRMSDGARYYVSHH